VLIAASGAVNRGRVRASEYQMRRSVMLWASNDRARDAGRTILKSCSNFEHADENRKDARAFTRGTSPFRCRRWRR